MIKVLKQKIKELLHSSNTPDFLFSIYFNKKDKKNRAHLTQLLESKTDLLSLMKKDQRAHWQERIDKVLDAKENKNIPRDFNAGKIIGSHLIMHNGLKVDPLSYYNYPMLKMLMENKGVHEPEEERIFQEVTATLDATKQLSMLELGSYWSFYSMWFLKLFPNANCVMVEPDRKNLSYGKKNFVINNFKGTFIHAGISSERNTQFNTISVDEICRQKNIEFLDILHSDIQGFETQMLQGAKKMLTEKRVGFVFVSTHSNDLHSECKSILESYNYTEVANVDLDESSSWDGILVMKSPNYSGLEKVEVLKQQKL